MPKTSKGMYSRLAAKVKNQKDEARAIGSVERIDPPSSTYDFPTEDRINQQNEILERLVEPIEVVCNVTFWSSRESSLVAVLNKADLKHLQCANEVKVVLQKDLIKKGVHEVPIWEFGCSTREKLAKCPMFTLHEEDSKAEKAAKRTAKKMEEEDQEPAEG